MRRFKYNSGAIRRYRSISLHHGRFYFHEGALFELPAQGSDDARTRYENFLRFRIGDQIQVTLAVADLDIFESVPLFGQAQ
jgi:hypothetical protein